MITEGVSRREFMVLAGAATVAAGLPASASTGSVTVFPYGTHVYREPPLPFEQLAADFPLLKKLGFTMIKIQESWSVDEPRRGEVDLSRVERVVAEARKSGLLVYFGVTMEQAPAWLWRQYPEASMVYEDGTLQRDPSQYLLASDGKPGPCWHHAEARAAAEKFLKELATRLARYDNIAVWNVWQEIGLAPWSTRPGHRYLCYCVNTLNAYRAWLKVRFATLAALNAKWRTAFGDWEEIEPPRLFTPVPASIDWRIFMETVYLGEVLKWKGAAIRSADPLARPIMAHGPSPFFGSTADFGFARSVDVYGSSAYPSWSEAESLEVSPEERLRKSEAPLEQLWSGVMMRADYIRSASPTGNFWAAELEGGRAGGGVLPGRVPDPGDIRRWVLASLAGGVRGISFWNHRSEPLWSEASGFGLLDREGSSTARAEEAGRISHAIQPHAQLFTAGAVPRGSVGIVAWERLYQFACASDPPSVKADFLAAQRGAYKALWRAGFAVDFIDAEALPEDASQYRALVLTAPLCLSSAVAAKFLDYVNRGGILISDACPGRFDENGMGRPGEMAPEFNELFGATHDRLVAWSSASADGFPQLHAAAPVLSGVGELAGRSVQTSMYLQTLKLGTAHAVLTSGEHVAGCAQRFGKGRAVLIGTLLGPAVLTTEDSGNARVLTELVRASGAEPDVIGALLRRRRVHGDTTAWFLINPTHQRVVERVPIGNFRTVVDLLNGPLRAEGGSVPLELGPLDIACLVLR